MGDAKPDSKGRKPDDVLRLFIEAVNSTNYAQAETFWDGACLRISKPIPFPVYCEGYAGLKTYSITKPTRGKADCYNMYLNGTNENGEVVRGLFGVDLINGEWKLWRGYAW